MHKYKSPLSDITRGTEHRAEEKEREKEGLWTRKEDSGSRGRVRPKGAGGKAPISQLTHSSGVPFEHEHVYGGDLDRSRRARVPNVPKPLATVGGGSQILVAPSSARLRRIIRQPRRNSYERTISIMRINVLL